MMVHAQDPQAIEHAVQILTEGGLLGLPTETVYGLAADATQDEAVKKIFAAKSRPSDHPLIVHIASLEQGQYFAQAIPEYAHQLMQAFWPGPLTLIVPRREHIATVACGGQTSVGLRCPAHPVAQHVLQAALQAGIAGLAAPSANQFGRISPTCAAHVRAEFGDALYVLDGGECSVGIESTIIDCTRHAPVLLRPGMITRQQIENACGERVLAPDELDTPAPKAAGTLLAHYAPRAKLRLMDAAMLQTALDVLGQHSPVLGVYTRTPMRCHNPQVVQRTMPQDPELAARELFATLRNLDEAQVQLIWVEPPPPTPDWEGVSDRLRRAAASH